MPNRQSRGRSHTGDSDLDSSHHDSSDSDTDGDVVLAEPQPPVVMRKGWTLRGDALYCKGHPRMPPHRLRLLLDVRGRAPLKSAEDIEAKESIDGMNLNRFLASQFRHYGLYRHYAMDVEGTYSSRVLERKLFNAISHGLCDNIPESVLKIHRKLIRKNRSAMEAYHQELARWSARLTRKNGEAPATGEEEVEESQADKEWRRLEDNPGERANTDLNRFFDEYFLKDGKPDNSKTPNAIRLDGLNDRAEVTLRIKTVPGLFFFVSSQGSGSIIVLGFDLGKVKDAVRQIESDATKAFETLWKRNYDAHRDLILRHRTISARRVLGLQDCAGTYQAQWTTMDGISNSRTLIQNVSIHISATLIASGRAMIAGVDFGVCAGTMHLSEHLEVLDDLADGRYDADVDPSEAPRTPQAQRRRRFVDAQSGRQPLRRAGPLTPPQERFGLEAIMGLSVSFRGRKTVEGDSHIFHIPRSGKLKFWDASYCRITGSIDLPTLGTVKIEAWKIANTIAPDEEPRPWDDFSEISFKRERKEARREQGEEAEVEVEEWPSRKRKRGKSEKRSKSADRGRKKRHSSGSSRR